LFYNKFIVFIYMFRALLCSSSEGQNCIMQHLVSSHSAEYDDTRCCIIQFDLLMVSRKVPEICRGIQ